MIKFLKNILTSVNTAHQQMADLGITWYPSAYGCFTHFNQEVFDRYMKQKHSTDNDN